MPGKIKPVTDKEIAVQEALDDLLGGAGKRYVVIDREANAENPHFGTYRCYASFEKEEEPQKQVALHLINFLDGFLDDKEFMAFAHMASRRALERYNLTEVGEAVSQAMQRAVDEMVKQERGSQDAN